MRAVPSSDVYHFESSPQYGIALAANSASTLMVSLRRVSDVRGPKPTTCIHRCTLSAMVG